MARLRLRPMRVTVTDTRRVKPIVRVHDAYYDSDGFKAWAAVVKRRAGYACEDRDHDSERPRSGARARLVADHIVERRDGGTDTLDNGMCRCWSCHERKSAEARARRAAQRF